MEAKSEYERACARRRQREAYAYYKARGICPSCRAKPSPPGSVYCEACREAQRGQRQKYVGGYFAVKSKERRERLKSEGLCVRCGKPAEAGRVLCPTYAQKNRESVKASIARRKCNAGGND